ncbi:MAG: hypothetical protein Q8P86_01470 [bacterium]|nr:hypothetical protein [bacterium]
MSQHSPLYENIKNNPVVYVTRDLERACGLPLPTEGYHIITNKARKDADPLYGTKENVTVVVSEKKLDTHELLKREESIELFSRLGKAGLLVFKNTLAIERTAKELGITLLNPPSEIARLAEEKTSQGQWLENSSKFLPPHVISKIKEINLKKYPSIIQFNHAHSGEGTLLVTNNAELSKLKTKFPEREVRLSEYIKGPVFTTNAVVFDTKIAHGNISFQITGLSPFTDLPFSSVGNDWGLPKKMLSKEQTLQIREIMSDIGMIFQKHKWRGLFGADFAMDEKTRRIYLLEVNARQTANVAWEATLQKKNDPTGLSVFEEHLLALLEMPLPDLPSTELRNGGQLIQRLTDDWLNTAPLLKTDKFGKEGLSVHAKNEDKPNAAILQIQSQDSVLADQKNLNQNGEKIKRLLPLFNVTTKKLLPEAIAIVNNYLHLPLPVPVPCPYFNNRRSGIRGAVKAAIGKGSVEEIKEEAELIFMKNHMDFSKLDKENIIKILVDNRIGVDCSGFAYHVLNAEGIARGCGALKSRISFSNSKSFSRALLSRLRTIQNTSVATFSHDANSKEVRIDEVSPGDFISMLHDSEDERQFNHMVVISEVKRQEETPLKLKYVHSLAWPSDGPYGHGVREGVIEITDVTKPVSEQKWVENGKMGAENLTQERAKKSEVSIRRLKWF